MRNGRLGNPEHRVDVGLERLVELGCRDVENGILRDLASRVIDKDVESAELASRRGHQSIAERFVLDVARNGDRLAARGADALHYLARVRLFRWQIIDRYIGTLASVGYCRGSSDAGIAAGNERLATHEPTGALVTRLAVVGSRIHLGGEARPGLLLFGK